MKDGVLCSVQKGPAYSRNFEAVQKILRGILESTEVKSTCTEHCWKNTQGALDAGYYVSIKPKRTPGCLGSDQSDSWFWLGSWDRVPRWAPCSAESLLQILSPPLTLPQLTLAHSL